MRTSLMPVLVIAAMSTLAMAADKPATPATQGNKYGHMKQDDSAVQLRMDMRRLWEDHISYTHSYVVSAIEDLPDAQVVADRLLRNQDDIGAAIQPYYGDAAAKKLATLLREHITIAADVVKAAESNNKAELATQQKHWTANGKSIAALLSGANPGWKQQELEAMMQTHLDLLTKLVTARLNKDWNGEIRAYDEGHDHILKLADALSAGIQQQFPDRFAQASN